MSQCKIYLENYSGVYYAGSEIRGRIECYFNDEVTVRGIKIRVRCKEHNSWTGTETYRDPLDDKTKTRHITLSGDHNVMYFERMLFGSDSGNRELPSGRHVYPFSCMLPHDIPSTFNGPHGSVSYKIKAIVDRPMRTDYEDVFIFVVQSPIDFNHLSEDLQDISTYSDEKTVCCWCCQGGNITMDVELPKIAFVPGETIPFKVKINNLSNSNVENVKIKFVKTITYRVTSPHSESKEDIDNIISFQRHGVGAHGEHTFDLDLAIPGYLEVPNFTQCELFKANYELKVSAEMPSCVLDLDVSAWDIKLGNVQRSVFTSGPAGDKAVAPENLNLLPGGPYPAPGGPYPPVSGTYPPPPAAHMPPNNLNPSPSGPYPPGMHPPAGGPYPPAGGPYPPEYLAAVSGGYPPGYPAAASGGYPPYPGNSSEKSFAPAGPPSAPTSSIASAPIDDNPKAREAGNPGGMAGNGVPELPPPSYNQIQQQNVNLPYPPP